MRPWVLVQAPIVIKTALECTVRTMAKVILLTWLVQVLERLWARSLRTVRTSQSTNLSNHLASWLGLLKKKSNIRSLPSARASPCRCTLTTMAGSKIVSASEQTTTEPKCSLKETRVPWSRLFRGPISRERRRQTWNWAPRWITKRGNTPWMETGLCFWVRELHTKIPWLLEEKIRPHSWKLTWNSRPTHRSL